MLALADRWLPGADRTPETLGTAKWLEDEHWRRMEIAIANGISRAFNGN
ncbi:DUF6890 family protein [Pseudomonas putida]